MDIFNSIIIAHRNRLQYLSCLLESLIIAKKHSSREHEIVIVDLNSSCDISITDIVKRCNNFIKINVIKNNYNGVFYKTKAINCAVLNSKGKYISLLDADTAVSPSYLQGIEDFYNKIEDKTTKLCYRVVKVTSNEKNKLFSNISEDYLNSLINIIRNFTIYQERFTENEIINKSFNIINKKLLTKALGNSHFTLLKKDFITIGGYNESMIGYGSEDKEFNLRYYRKFRKGVLREDNKYVCFSLPCQYEKNWKVPVSINKISNNVEIYKNTISKNISTIKINKDWGKF